jgi:VWFA-related protein
VGGNAMTAQFATLDFAEMLITQQNEKNKKEQERRKGLIDSGTVSALDLAAPSKAVDEYNKASGLLRGQHSQEAIEHLQKAVTIYPKFVSAHNSLGMAYLDADDPVHAQSEFEAAIKLDDKFASPFISLGRLALTQENYEAAGGYLQKASLLRPKDAAVLVTLAYAQNGNHQYREAIQTADRVHAMNHPDMGNVHYVAFVAAVALNDSTRAQGELDLFLGEDPSNPLAPVARANLDILKKNQQVASIPLSAQSGAPGQTAPATQDLASSAHLKAQLAGAGDEIADDRCTDCVRSALMAEANSAAASIPDVERSAPEQWTIRRVVDEVAVFFGVTSGGHTVSGLTLDEITVRDDNQPPAKVLQFTPQSKLPLRIGLLIDTSGSVQPRFSFEKRAASNFLEQMLGNPSDLGFVAGFSNEVKVTQDFTAEHKLLEAGINQLSNAGGTALFDAVSRACWKLAAYPEHERVARVLVVLSDGQENSSRTSLRQTIRDMEATGVTVYTISTKEAGIDKTDADKVLQVLAERSGGESFFPGDMQTLGRSFDKLRDEIRSRYLIAYRPAGFEPNGKFRAISITAEKNGKQLHVHARKGYHARSEAATP